MINETIINYLLLFIFLEFYEVSWQKAKSMMGMLAKMHYQYSKSIFLFLIMHPTFYFSIGFAMLTNYNSSALLLLFLKTIDVATKIVLIEQVFIKKDLSKELTLSLLAPLPNMMPYLGIVLYPPLIFLAL